MKNKYHELSVDFSSEKGRIAALNGVNLGPVTMNGFMDLSEWHRELKIPHTRLHDCPYAVPDAVDVHCIFPRFDADIDDPKNYNFAVSDDYIQAILDVNSEIVFRLGETIEHYTRNKYYAHPPKNYERWAKICVNIMRHYNDGWADGFEHNIEYWEIWNEPWNQPTCWTGTDDEWIDFYAITSKIIKAYDPTRKIGGPAAGGRISEFVLKFLDRCQKDQLPLDFYSWHHYGDHPENILNYARKVRSELDRRGFENCESHLNEWNYHPNEDWSWRYDLQTWGKEVFMETQGEVGASFDASVLIGMQDVNIDVANFYWAKEGWWGLFDHWGAPQKNYYAFLAFAKMLNTPKRVSCEGSEPEKGTDILAGINEAGDEANVLISRFRAESDCLKLSLKSFPWSENTRYQISIVDEKNNLEVISRGELGRGHFAGSKVKKDGIEILHVSADPYAVLLIKFTPLA